MSGLSDRGVALFDAKREPSLLNLRVGGTSQVEVSIDPGEDVGGGLIESSRQSLNENNLQVRVVVVDEIIFVVRASLTSTGDVGISHVTSLSDVLTAEVEMSLGRKTGSVHPGAPIDLGKDSVDLGLVDGGANVILPCFSELIGLNGGLRVVQNISLEEGLEAVFSDQALQEGEELEALLVGNGTEGSIRGVALKGGMKR